MKSSFVQTRDLRMHYLQSGSGEPVVFLHGFPETSYEWRHQLAHFAPQYACFAPDTRGYGRTDKPGIRCTRQLLAQDIVDFMDALGIGRAAVVAHDWGGIIAFKLAVDWPDRVSRLALLDTLCTVWPPVGGHGFWFKAAPHPEELFANHHRQFIDSVFGGEEAPALAGPPRAPWTKLGGKRWITNEALDHYRAAFADPLSHFHAISYYRYALPFHIVTPDPDATHGERYRFLSEPEVADMWRHPEGLQNHPLFGNYMDYGPEDRHKRFEKPTLWMYGAGSAAGDPNNPAMPRGNPFFDQFPRYFPDLRTRAIPGGHFFPEESPAETNAALEAFLAGRS
jgi:pimeloyl-ACP methyl ester carboxylesterase